MPGTFSDKEITRVRTRYRHLYQTESGIVEGILDMYATYDGKNLEENFRIKITANNLNSTRIPALYETGGLTQAIATKYDIADLRVLHCNPSDGSVCVCVKQEERHKYPPGSELFDFIENLAVPYLYGLTHYDKYGYWPWGDYSHGPLGLLEFYADQPIEQSTEDIADVLALIRKEVNWKRFHQQIRNPNKSKHCVCGSERPFGVCHGKAFKGLCYFRGELERHKISLRGLF